MSDVGDALDASTGHTGEPLDSADLLWRREGRPPTVGEAREYFDAHAASGGDPEILAECEAVLDAVRRPTRAHPEGETRETGPVTFPAPTEDQLEEKGSD